MIKKSVRKIQQFKPAEKIGSKRLGVYIGVFAVIGGAAIILTHAATSSSFFEPEGGSRSSSVTIGSDTNASGQSYVKFNPATSGGAQFQTSFDTAADLTNNFDYAYGGAFYPPGDPNRVDTWLGDHDSNCGSDGTYRTIQYGQTKADAGSSVYVCPLAGDPHGGHMMMSYYSVGMNGLWVSPKPMFNNVKKVCWDMNLTFLGGRDFFDVVIAAKSDIDANTARNGYYDLAFSPPNYQDLSVSTTGVIPTAASVGFQYYSGWFSMWRQTTDLGVINGPYTPEDLSMHRLCAMDNNNGTVTLTQERPGSGTLSSTFAGSFPAGQVRVVFEALVHNASKDAAYDPHQNTWHLDNILIQ